MGSPRPAERAIWSPGEAGPAGKEPADHLEPVRPGRRQVEQTDARADGRSRGDPAAAGPGRRRPRARPGTGPPESDLGPGEPGGPARQATGTGRVKISPFV